MVDDEVVGSATLLKHFDKKDDETLVTKIHGNSLSKWETSGEHLVAITNVNIDISCESISNPYRYKIGIEDAPVCLKEMLQNGVYPWDIFSMKPTE